MPEIVRKQVIPGEVIVSGDYRPGSFVERRGNELVALRIGLAEIIRSDVKVIPLSGAYLPRSRTRWSERWSTPPDTDGR